jgi:hypothetical protein
MQINHTYNKFPDQTLDRIQLINRYFTNSLIYPIYQTMTYKIQVF